MGSPLARAYLITTVEGTRTRFRAIVGPDPPACEMLEHGIRIADYRAEDDPLTGSPDPAAGTWNLCRDCMAEVLVLVSRDPFVQAVEVVLG